MLYRADSLEISHQPGQIVGLETAITVDVPGGKKILAARIVIATK